MSDTNTHGPFCTCQRVKHTPRKHGDGTLTDSWSCEYCGRRFVSEHQFTARDAELDAAVERLRIRLAARDAEIARLREALEDLLGWQTFAPEATVDRARSALEPKT